MIGIRGNEPDGFVLALADARIAKDRLEAAQEACKDLLENEYASDRCEDEDARLLEESLINAVGVLEDLIEDLEWAAEPPGDD